MTSCSCHAWSGAARTTHRDRCRAVGAGAASGRGDVREESPRQSHSDRHRLPADLVAKINGPLLEQAVINLIDNAIKYSDAGATVHVTVAREDSAVVIRVVDNGRGIAANHLPRLFERFYRVNKARSRELGGTGLGLAIVKHIMTAHQGSVHVESTIGRGSTFTLRLPQALPSPGETPDSETADDETPVAPPGEVVALNVT